MSAPARSLLNDELDGVVSTLCARFPTRRRSEIERAVADVYDRLAGNATITAHLIPLTLNRSRRVLLDRMGEGERNGLYIRDFGVRISTASWSRWTAHPQRGWQRTGRLVTPRCDACR